MKAARGGYDGRGVLFPDEPRTRPSTMIDELDVHRATSSSKSDSNSRGELAQVVVRGVDGEYVVYPLVTTVQSDGMCVEVRFPAEVDDERPHARRARLGRKIATLDRRRRRARGRVLRDRRGPHRERDRAATPQLGPLDDRGRAHQSVRQSPARRQWPGPRIDATPIARRAVMVNVVGADAPGSLDARAGVAGVHVHDYGKSWRPGRKLGHVTVRR